MFMNIPGVYYQGVFSANEFLTRINLMKASPLCSDTPIQHTKKVAVVGSEGMVRRRKRCRGLFGIPPGHGGAPARKEEVEHAEEEGILQDPQQPRGDPT